MLKPSFNTAFSLSPWLAVVAGIGLLAGCSSDKSEGPTITTKSITIEAVNKSGYSGQALLATRADQTEVLIAVGKGVTPEGDFPVEIQRGTCEGIAGDKRFELGELNGGTLAATVAAPLKDLTAEKHAIVVFQSRDRSVYLACGPI